MIKSNKQNSDILTPISQLFEKTLEKIEDIVTESSRRQKMEEPKDESIDKIYKNKELKIIEEEIAKKNKEFDAVCSEVNKIKYEHEKMKDRNESLVNELERLCAAKNKTIQKIKAIKEENKLQEKQLEKNKDKLEKSKKCLKLIKSDAIALAKGNQNINNENISLKENIQMQNQKYSENSKAIENQNKVIESNNEKLKNQRRTLGNLLSDNTYSQSRIAENITVSPYEYNESNEKKFSELINSSLKLENDQLNYQVNKLLSAKETYKQEKERELDRRPLLTQEINVLNKEISLLNVKKDELLDEIAAFEREKIKMERIISYYNSNNNF